MTVAVATSSACNSSRTKWLQTGNTYTPLRDHTFWRPELQGTMNMATIKAGNVSSAVSAGLGLGLGLILTKYMLQAAKPQESTARQLIICLKCAGKNQLENKYCWHCGHSLYPVPSTQCGKCRATVPSMRYCGNCGTKLRK